MPTVLSFIRKLFQKKIVDSETITGFDDAVAWIETYRKAKNFDTALMAAHELLLRVKTAITWNEQAERKAMNFENANIESVVKTAVDKRKVIKSRLDTLYHREAKISKLIGDLKKEKVLAEEKELELRRKVRFAEMDKMVKEYLHKKEYPKAIALANAMVQSFEGNPKAIRLLTKVQKIVDKQKSKEEKREAGKKSVEKYIKEVGMELDNQRNQVAVRKISLKHRIKLFFAEYGKSKRERSLYLREQRTLKEIEQLLIRSGGVLSVSDDSSYLLEALKSGTTRAVSNFVLPGFDFFGEIRGKDSIVGDTFGSYSDGKRTVFYFGDATGHGVQAGFTVAILSKLFYEHAPKIKSFPELVMRLNNDLKDRIKARMFITAVFFEYDENRGTIQYIGAGHDKFIVYRAEERAVELIVPGNLALGVRSIKNIASLKPKELAMKHRDAIFGYTDGFVEARSPAGVQYGLDRLAESFKKALVDKAFDPAKTYQKVFTDARDFMPDFDDDVSGFIWVRNTSRDVVVDHSQLQGILDEVGLSEREAKKFSYKNKTREEVLELLKKEKFERELRVRMIQLDNLYKMGEYIKLKARIQECFREGYVHERMKKYLEKIIQNEDKFRLAKLEDRLRKKYETLVDLQKKGENEIVIREIVEIITRQGKI